jgi:hypothetical protein
LIDGQTHLAPAMKHLPMHIGIPAALFNIRLLIEKSLFPGSCRRNKQKQFAQICHKKRRRQKPRIARITVFANQ